MVAFEVTATQLGVPSDTIGVVSATEEVFLSGDTKAPVPRIDGVHMVVNGRRTSDIVLHFSQPMDPASVQNVKAYSVKLHLAQSVDTRDVIQISQSPLWYRRDWSFSPDTNLLRDAEGTPIPEDGSGQGGAFLITLTSKSAKIDDGVTQSDILDFSRAVKEAQDQVQEAGTTQAAPDSE